MSALIQGKQITREQDSMLHTKLVKPSVDLRQVTVLGARDWQRIQDELNYKEIEAERIRRCKEKRERIKEKSENIVKNWPNSLMNLRQKKLDDIKKKKDAAEDRRKERDLEWAEYQAALRKDIIEKAKEKQYYQTERVRNLHSAYMMSEVMKEREEQIKLKQILADIEKIRDKEWDDKVQEENEKIMKIEKLKLTEIRNSLIHNAEFVKNQMHHKLELEEKEKEKLRKEQLELNKLAEKWRLENKELYELHREKIRKNAADNRKQMEENEQIQKLQAQLEEEDNKQCRIYAEAKRKLMKLRSTREKEISEERQQHLEYIVERLSHSMKRKKDDEDERIAKAVAEIEAKKKEEEEEKERKHKEVVAQCLQHMKYKIKEGEKLKEETIKADREFLKERIEADAICHRNDIEKIQKLKQDKHDLRDYHKIQIEQKRILEEEQEELNRKYTKAMEDLKRQEERQFQVYASNLIQQCAQKGRNVYPLVAAARNKSAPPQNKPPPDDDKKNLGFIW